MHSFGPFWSNGVKKKEIDLFWCISMTNNVKSYKQINGRAQIQCFYKGTSGALCWKCYKPQKLGKLKHLVLNSKVYNICHFWYFWPRTWGLKNWKSPLNGQTSKLSQTYSVTYQNLCEKGTKPMTMALSQWQKKLSKEWPTYLAPTHLPSFCKLVSLKTPTISAMWLWTVNLNTTK